MRFLAALVRFLVPFTKSTVNLLGDFPLSMSSNKVRTKLLISRLLKVNPWIFSNLSHSLWLNFMVRNFTIFLLKNICTSLVSSCFSSPMSTNSFCSTTFLSVTTCLVPATYMAFKAHRFFWTKTTFEFHKYLIS